MRVSKTWNLTLHATERTSMRTIWSSSSTRLFKYSFGETAGNCTAGVASLGAASAGAAPADFLFAMVQVWSKYKKTQGEDIGFEDTLCIDIEVSALIVRLGHFAGVVNGIACYS